MDASKKRMNWKNDYLWLLSPIVKWVWRNQELFYGHNGWAAPASPPSFSLTPPHLMHPLKISHPVTELSCPAQSRASLYEQRTCSGVQEKESLESEWTRRVQEGWPESSAPLRMVTFAWGGEAASRQNRKGEESERNPLWKQFDWKREIVWARTLEREASI